MKALRFSALALAMAFAPLAASAQDGALAITAGFGSLDGSGNPLTGVPHEMPTAYSHLDTDNSDTVFSGSLTWFPSKQWGFEVWASQSAKQSVEIDNEPTPDQFAASYTVRPVMLSAQYHFAPMGRLKPFVGLGWHWTSVGGIKQDNALIDRFDLSGDNGWAAVAGLDVTLSGGWFARADVRYMDWSTERTEPGNATAPKKSTGMNSTYYGAAIGYRF